MTPWWNHVRNAFSQLLNAVAGGHEDETYSSRCGKACYWDQEKSGCLRAKLVNLLFWDRFHCWNAIETDEGHRLGDVPHWWSMPNLREAVRIDLFGAGRWQQFDTSQTKADDRRAKRMANRS